MLICLYMHTCCFDAFPICFAHRNAPPLSLPCPLSTSVLLQGVGTKTQYVGLSAVQALSQANMARCHNADAVPRTAALGSAASCWLDD